MEPGPIELTQSSSNLSSKYFVTCPRVTSSVLKGLNANDKNIVMRGLMKLARGSQDTGVVVKVGSTDSLLNEFKTAKMLFDNDVPGVLKYICYFTCADDYTTYARLCNGPGDSMRVLVMPYMCLGSLKSYRNWTNHDQVRSALKQVIATIVQSYSAANIIQSDRHPDNVLLKRTSKPLISYRVDGREFGIPTYGLRTLCMDFENSMDLSGLPVETTVGSLAMMDDLGTAVVRFNTDSISLRISNIHEFDRVLARIKERIGTGLPWHVVLQLLLDVVDRLRFEPHQPLQDLIAQMLADRGYR